MVMLCMTSAADSRMNEGRMVCIFGATHYEVLMADLSDNGLPSLENGTRKY